MRVGGEGGSEGVGKGEGGVAGAGEGDCLSISSHFPLRPPQSMISLWGMKPADQAFGNEKNLHGESLPITSGT